MAFMFVESSRRGLQDPPREIREGNEPPEVVFLPESRPEAVTFVRHVHPPPKNGREFRYPDGSETCPVCLDSISAPMTVSPCYHLFCMHCIVKWLKTKTLCPYCRGPVSSVIHKDDQDFYVEINLGGADCNSVLEIDENGAIRLVPAESLSDNSENITEDGEYPPIVQPNRIHIYFGIYVRQLVSTCNLPYNRGDIDRIRQWIRREVETIFSMLDFDNVNAFTRNLIKNLVSKTKKVVIYPYKYSTKKFRATCHSYFGPMTQIFVDELRNFALSGQSMENYDRTTYYRYVPLFDSDF